MSRWGVFSLAALAASTVSARALADASPHLSEEWLPSSNGMAAIAWDRTQHKLVQFLEHPYQQASATSALTRNFAYDSYPGVRVGATGTWLNGVAPAVVEYLPGTGIVHSRRMLSGLQIDEYDFTPMGLAEYAGVTLVKVTQTGSAGPVDVYSLFNYHLGTGAPSPGADSESITYDAAHDAYYETGPSGVAMGYLSIVPSTHHGSTPNNPFGILNAGGNLMDDSGTGGPTTDAVCGFQSSLGALAQGASGWAGWVSVLAPDANGSAAATRVRTWIAGRSAAQVLSDEIAAWGAWVTAPPAGTSALEAQVAQQAEVVLRMGQVTETGAANGQILASVAPGSWNISWVRDMAYATVGLVRAGHYAEAKAAIAFQMGATTNAYESYVGSPYQISVVRYYGNGTEWSDSNQNGPNVEFDGFGLFLWELDEYVRASGDMSVLTSYWPAVKSKVADVLVKLQESSGLISADSSIWEVHWNGQQRHFAYTTIAAANGLCAASRLATAAGDATSSASYLTAGQKARDAILSSLRAPDGTIAQSTEGLAAGTGWLDAATIEAINFGLIDPSRRTARATLASIENGLVPMSGRGFMRSNAGDAYSSNEWVFIDLRAARALELQGNATYASNLFAWNVDQAADNYDELSELHDPVTASYAGQAPMVGFGAGAYLLRLYDRGKSLVPTCGSFAAEPADPVDAGADAAAPSDGGHGSGDAGVVTDAGMHADAGDGGRAGGDAGAPDGGQASDAGTAGGQSSGGCGCVAASPADGASALLLLAPLGAMLARRRMRGMPQNRERRS